VTVTHTQLWHAPPLHLSLGENRRLRGMKVCARVLHGTTHARVQVQSQA
jgi:hypothetical protein